MLRLAAISNNFNSNMFSEKANSETNVLYKKSVKERMISFPTYDHRLVCYKVWKNLQFLRVFQGFRSNSQAHHQQAQVCYIDGNAFGYHCHMIWNILPSFPNQPKFR